MLPTDLCHLTDKVDIIDDELQLTKQMFFAVRTKFSAQAIIRELKRHMEDSDNSGSRNNIRVRGHSG